MKYPSIAILGSLLALAGCGGFGPDPTDGISLPDGFEIEIAAGPPLVERPMIVDRDDRGYLYVAESSGSNDDVQTQLAERPHRILRLEDANGDGRYDGRTVFADKMMLPEGVLWHDGSLYVTAPPSIWKLTDTDEDGVADLREEWFDAKTLTGCANDLHGPYLGLDGWIYWTKGAFAEQTYDRPGREPFVTRAAHIFRRRVNGGPVEPVLTGGMDNPVEVVFTPEGERLFTSTFLVHPGLGQRDGIAHAVYGGVYGKVHGVTDGHPMTGGYLSVMTHMGGAAPVGLARYESGAFGEEYRGRLFSTSFNLRKVTSHRLVPAGATFVTEDSDFLVSESWDFHPTDVMEDADGSLLVVDTGPWYKLCCPTSQLAKPELPGAIYRVRRTGTVPPEGALGTDIAWEGLAAEDLIALLGDHRPAIRKRAIAALAKAQSVEALKEAVETSRSVDVRRNAVWALTRIDSDRARSAVRAALADTSEGVRHAALHSVALHRDAKASTEVVALLQDPSDAIKRVAAEALGRIGDPAAVGPLLDAAGLAEDQVLRHSLTYALIEIGDPRSTRAGLAAEEPRVRRAAMIALDQMDPPSLDPGTVLRGLESSNTLISATSHWIANRHPEWGGYLVKYFEGRLEVADDGGSRGLAAQLERFARNEDVQALLARTATVVDRPEASKVALTAMAAAPVKLAPEGWAEAIAIALTREQTLSGALLAARRLPRPDDGLPELDAALLDVARDDRVDASVRILALDATGGAVNELEAELFDLAAPQALPSVTVEVRAAASRILGRASLDTPQLMALAALLPQVGPMELPQLVTAFGKSTDPEVGARFAAGLSKAKGLANLRADILEAAARGYPQYVQERLDSLLAGEVTGIEQSKASLDGLLASLEEGDIVRGQAVFNSSETACLACHAIGYQGGKVGPDLTRIGEIRSRRDLLEAIMYPSASFVRSYEPIVAVTADETISGVAMEESESHLLLAVNADDRVRVLRSDIEEMRPGTVSVMPSGLETQLSHGELADLLAFLEATQWGPRRGKR